MKSARQTEIRGAHPCGPDFQVSTLVSRGTGSFLYRREPCHECPWRKDAPIGAFPAEAYRHSARTCADMAQSTFACHVSGASKPATCAGFLLSESADHNLTLRLRMMDGGYDPGTVSSQVPLYASYREMAVANGVAPDDPALAQVRDRVTPLHRMPKSS